MKLYDNYTYQLKSDNDGTFYPKVSFQGGLFNFISYELKKLNKKYEIPPQYILTSGYDICHSMQDAEKRLMQFIKLIIEIDSGDIKKREKEYEDVVHAGTFDDFHLFTI